jgi:hypothetical protein
VLIASLAVVGLAATAAAIGDFLGFLSRGQLSSAFGIAVSRSGDIYVGDSFSRVAVFAPSGEQLRSWSVSAGSGLFRLRFQEDGLLEVAAVRTGRVYTFEPNGRPLGSRADPNAYHAFGPERDFEAPATSGDLYRIVDASSIVIEFAGGGREIVVPPPSWLALPRGVPAEIFALLGAFLLSASALAFFSRRSARRAGAA